MSCLNICEKFKKKKIIVLVGIHGSGKSTLGNQLKKRGYQYFPEIGTELREMTENNVSVFQKNFDIMVLRRELARDKEILANIEAPVVETWHFGNYAFSNARFSFMEMEYESCLRKKLTEYYPLVIRMTIDDATFLNRNCEKNISPISALEFYKRVERELNLIICKYKKEKLIEVIDYDGMSVDNLLLQIERYVAD